MIIKIVNETAYAEAIERIGELSDAGEDTNDSEELKALMVAVKIYNNQQYKIHTINSLPGIIGKNSHRGI